MSKVFLLFIFFILVTRTVGLCQPKIPNMLLPKTCLPSQKCPNVPRFEKLSSDNYVSEFIKDRFEVSKLIMKESLQKTFQNLKDIISEINQTDSEINLETKDCLENQIQILEDGITKVENDITEVDSKKTDFKCHHLEQEPKEEIKEIVLIPKQNLSKSDLSRSIAAESLNLAATLINSIPRQCLPNVQPDISGQSRQNVRNTRITNHKNRPRVPNFRRRLQKLISKQNNVQNIANNYQSKVSGNNTPFEGQTIFKMNFIPIENIVDKLNAVNANQLANTSPNSIFSSYCQAFGANVGQINTNYVPMSAAFGTNIGQISTNNIPISSSIACSNYANVGPNNLCNVPNVPCNKNQMGTIITVQNITPLTPNGYKSNNIQINNPPSVITRNNLANQILGINQIPNINVGNNLKATFVPIQNFNRFTPAQKLSDIGANMLPNTQNYVPIQKLQNVKTSGQTLTNTVPYVLSNTQKNLSLKNLDNFANTPGQLTNIDMTVLANVQRLLSSQNLQTAVKISTQPLTNIGTGPVQNLNSQRVGNIGTMVLPNSQNVISLQNIGTNMSPNSQNTLRNLVPQKPRSALANKGPNIGTNNIAILNNFSKQAPSKNFANLNTPTSNLRSQFVQQNPLCQSLSNINVDRLANDDSVTEEDVAIICKKRSKTFFDIYDNFLRKVTMNMLVPYYISKLA